METGEIVCRDYRVLWTGQTLSKSFVSKIVLFNFDW